MPAALLTLLAEITALLADYGFVTVRPTHDGQVIWTDRGELDIYTADEALEIALELALLHDDVKANPGVYHLDTLASHGVMVPADHPQRGELFDPCAAGVSADCTGEGTAYAGRCLPCDLELAAEEELVDAGW